MSWYSYRPDVSVYERRRRAERLLTKAKKDGAPMPPVHVDGRAIAKSFWGRAWCENLERYSDFANRLPRGRTCVRNGSVIDLRISAGEVLALVYGSEPYDVCIDIRPIPADRWAALRQDCAGAVDSLLDLLQGRLSSAVMSRVCQPRSGLFPSLEEIKLDCSCPDWASMCKHVAAALYAVGARLDSAPELLFVLRGVEAQQLIAAAARGAPLVATRSERLLDEGDLSGLFDLELDETPAAPPGPAAPERPKAASSPAPAAARPAPKRAAPRAAAPSAGMEEAIAKVEARVRELRAAAESGPIVEAMEAWLREQRAKQGS